MDLSPPLALRDVSQVIREIMSVYDSSMLELDASAAGGKVLQSDERAEFDRIMDAAVNPALEMCRRMADLMKTPVTTGNTSLDWDKEIFLVNCAVHLQVCLIS
jgi:hypothetical protein